VHVPDLACELTIGGAVLIKTFFVGILLGIAAAAGALYAFPVVDQAREVSITTVAPNGGNVEAFRINIPADRVMMAPSGQATPVPPGLQWPDIDVLAGVRTEMFKIRNAHDVVIGVAIRNAATNEEQDVIDWVLHFPARGSVFVNMDAEPQEDGYRIGRFRAGSREFGTLSGAMVERWVTNTSNGEGASAGYIELLATYVGEPPLPASAEEPVK
jgi:hypothetical protein